MRKYLIVAIAALTAIAFTTVALAQGADTATLTTKLTPKKAGTKKKPKNSTLDLNVVNGNQQRTMSDLDILLPKNLKVSLKGMPTCSTADVLARAAARSPASSARVRPRRRSASTGRPPTCRTSRST